jgi:ABC-2 type transport system ATP-binding protein
MLELNNLIKQYDGIRAVDSIELKIEKGSIFGFLGPNGAGKTTTIRMIMGIIEPDSGDILFNQKNISKYGRDELGYLPEDRGLYQKQKLEETIKYFASLRGLDKEEGILQAHYWLERFDLLDQKNRKIEELSKGNQQKIQFILSLIHDPSLLILDEPFTGLDPLNQVLLKEIIQEKSNEGKTILFSTHQMEQVERLCDNICLINKGKIILNGNLEDIRKANSKNYVKVQYRGELDLDKIRSFFKKIKFNKSNFSGELAKPSSEMLEWLNKSVDVELFEMQAPTLEKIFIDYIKKSS